MWKVIAVIAVCLCVSANVMAADATPEARLKQMEDLGSARSRIYYKLEDTRRTLVAMNRSVGMRFNILQEKYQKARTSTSNKINLENAKPLKDQATLDACTAKLQSMDDTWNKIFAPAWNIFNNHYQVQYQIIYGQLNSVTGLVGYDDYVNRAGAELQPLVDALLAIEARIDVAKTKLTEATTEIGKAMDEAESVCKE